MQDVRHIYRIVGGGGENHELAIAEAAVLFVRSGYKVHDMTAYTESPYRPDLIVSKTDRYVSGAHRANRTDTFWIEIVDSSMPPRDFVKVPGTLIRIDIGRCKDDNERVSQLRKSIP